MCTAALGLGLQFCFLQFNIHRNKTILEDAYDICFSTESLSADQARIDNLCQKLNYIFN